MAADMPAADLGRMADEFGTFTMIYHRTNPAGQIVRDAKFITDAGSYDIAVILFQGQLAGAQVGLCAVLRGQVATVDDFELATGPVMDDQTRDRLASMDDGLGHWFTVFGSWDTGDGPRRYSKHVQAISPEHAELLVRSDKTVGTFLVAGVVEGWAQVEDSDATWATVDDRQPAAQDRRSWLRRKLDRLV